MTIPMPATNIMVRKRNLISGLNIPKKKFPIKTFVTVSPRISIKAKERVVNVVENAPIASAVWMYQRDSTPR